MGKELPSRDEVARYDSVQDSRPAAETSLGRPDRLERAAVRAVLDALAGAAEEAARLRS